MLLSSPSMIVLLSASRRCWPAAPETADGLKLAGKSRPSRILPLARAAS
jgi:hypothetical protein